MATVPVKLPIVPFESLIGQVDADDEPLATILGIGNWMYGRHTPALANGSTVGLRGTANTFFDAVIPSVDGIQYTVRTHTWGDTPLVSTTLTVETSTTSTTGAWTPLLTDTWTRGTEDEWRNNSTTMVIASTVRYLRYRLTSASACQLHHVMIYPTEQATVTGVKASDFTTFEDAHLVGGVGSAIHTEYFNRAKANVRAVLRDRYQRVWAYHNNDDRPDIYTEIIGATTLITSVLAGVAQAFLRGQAGATLTVRARITGGGTTTIQEEKSSDKVIITNDNTDRTGTLVIKTDSPVFRATIKPSGGGTQTPRYIVIDWQPGD